MNNSKPTVKGPIGPVAQVGGGALPNLPPRLYKFMKGEHATDL